MPTTRVTHAAKATNDLAAATEQQASTAAARIGEVAARLSVPVTIDVAAAVSFLATLTRAAAADAVAKDAVYRGAITGHTTPAADRDDSVHDLFDFVRGLRSTFANTFGRDVANGVFPGGETPRIGEKIVAYAGQVAKALAAPNAIWTPLPSAPAVIDVAASTAKLLTLTAAAEARLHAVRLHDAGAHDARQSREDGYATLHDVHQGLQHVMLGLLEAGGAHDLADHLFVHHHLSHAKHAKAPGTLDDVKANPKASDKANG